MSAAQVSGRRCWEQEGVSVLRSFRPVESQPADWMLQRWTPTTWRNVAYLSFPAGLDLVSFSTECYRLPSPLRAGCLCGPRNVKIPMGCRSIHHEYSLKYGMAVQSQKIDSNAPRIDAWIRGASRSGPPGKDVDNISLYMSLCHGDSVIGRPSFLLLLFRGPQTNSGSH